MFGDQPRNSFLVTEVLKIGLTVREWEKREEIVKLGAITKIHFHDIPTPDFDSPSPDPNALSKFPAQRIPSYNACKLLRKPIALLLGELLTISRRVVVVHDVLMSYNLQDVCSVHNAESYIFNCVKSTENKKQWAIGPILPIKQDHVSDKRNKCLDWLDNQPSRSVLYVSFGSSTTFTDKEVTELAMVLERSKQKFLWVLRDADRGDIFTGEARRFELLEGYEERAKGVRLVIRDWAPQLEILAHPSTGRFMSHCGWNSCIESITMGVPIATWPMHSEQPLNGFFATEILKTGLLVREWEKREELFSASVIENAVRKLMVSEEGDEIRKRAEELGEAVRQSTEKGGASRLELDSFIAHITR
ncbi:Zeatin O-xylosyltransferase [Capsicum chinense]|nr:Zeatin O-xylosyltransferase [Capsicum chinense]